MTASELAVAAGADTVNVSLSVGGTEFKASIDLTVQEAPQTLTSIQVLATVA
jgi:hypothetical protein